MCLSWSQTTWSLTSTSSAVFADSMTWVLPSSSTSSFIFLSLTTVCSLMLVLLVSSSCCREAISVVLAVSRRCTFLSSTSFSVCASLKHKETLACNDGPQMKTSYQAIDKLSETLCTRDQSLIMNWEYGICMAYRNISKRGSPQYLHMRWLWGAACYCQFVK